VVYVRHHPSKRQNEEGLQAGLPVPEPLLIPKEYHGEMLRNRGESDRSAAGEISDIYAGHAVEDIRAVSVEESTAMTMHADERTDAVMESIESPNVPKPKTVGGLGDVLGSLLGEGGSEDEVFLLLGVGLLLLFAHYDRHSNGEHSDDRWDLDDLALLMIAYLLLG